MTIIFQGNQFWIETVIDTVETLALDTNATSAVAIPLERPGVVVGVSGITIANFLRGPIVQVVDGVTNQGWNYGDFAVDVKFRVMSFVTVGDIKVQAMIFLRKK